MRFASTCLVACLSAGPAAGQDPIARGNVAVAFETVAKGLTAPLGVTHANDGSGRLFIWEQSGQIRIVNKDGALLPTPFLDISSKLPDLGSFFDERGLLGLAFHPNYRNNGRLFVRYSTPRKGDPDEPCSDPKGFLPGCHSEVLAEYQVSTNPNRAELDSERILFIAEEPQFNHDGGTVAFGPDGYLYFALGDGGGANDGLADVPPSHGPIGNAQNIETPLGAMLRIDVDGPPQDALEYAIPPDNPFVGGLGLDEIYAYGLRNPYKFSFDDGVGGTGALLVADVGQNLFEEISLVELGGNYGWPVREGLECFDPFAPDVRPGACVNTGMFGEPLIDPIAAYAHPGVSTGQVGGITVVGGFVYRGRSSSLFGRYVFGDFAQEFTLPSGELYVLDPAAGTGEIRKLLLARDLPFDRFLKGFGEGPKGELYVCSSTALAPFGRTGVVERLVVLGGNKFASGPMLGSTQVPPINTAATGLSRVRSLSPTLLDFRVDVSNIFGVTAAHIHLGGLGVNGPIVAEIYTNPAGADFPFRRTLTAGLLTEADLLARPEVGFDGTLDDLVAWMRAGAAYINIHTLAHPAGEIRGQIPVSTVEDLPR